MSVYIYMLGYAILKEREEESAMPYLSDNAHRWITAIAALATIGALFYQYLPLILR